MNDLIELKRPNIPVLCKQIENRHPHPLAHIYIYKYIQFIIYLIINGML